jgi:phosphoglycolate phosphatase
VLGPEASDADVERGLEFFLEYYSAHKLDHTQLYPGVKEALDRLLAAGVRMAVLTNKPVRISRAIVEGLGVGAHFCRVYGGNSFEKKKPDPEGVRRIMEECGASRERTLVVGDSSVDVITARSAGVMVFGVTYGFQPESLADPAPDMVMERMEDVAEWVIGQRTGAKQ